MDQPQGRDATFTVCRACATRAPLGADRCPACGGQRLIEHPELNALSIAHLDCDAFYAAVEKRDDPSLEGKPVIIGGGRRGVVSTACYVARQFGVGSAMPMFKALKACPDAIVIKPNMKKYAEVAKSIRALMNEVTPAVQPISIDEAFLDLTGTERLHRAIPAEVMVRLQGRIADDIGVSTSVGLSYNKFLAKLSSDLEKPSGFTVMGRADARRRLAPLPVTKLWGVGPALAKKLRRDGYGTIGDLQGAPRGLLIERYGAMGERISHLSMGEDSRKVHGPAENKSISAETTFHTDLSDLTELETRLWPLCERVSARAKKGDAPGKVITLKLKTASFRTLTRRKTLDTPTLYARDIFGCAQKLLRGEIQGEAYRLIGVGLSGFSDEEAQTDPELSLFAPAESQADDEKGRQAEDAMDRIRQKFGTTSIGTGRNFRSPPK